MPTAAIVGCLACVLSARKGGYLSQNARKSKARTKGGFGVKEDYSTPLHEAGGWRSLAAEQLTECPRTKAFEILRAKHDERLVSEKPLKHGIYTSLAEVVQYSRHISALQIPVPEALKNSVLQWKYSIPIARMPQTPMAVNQNRSNVCDIAHSNLKQEIAAREKKKKEGSEDKYSECILSRESVRRFHCAKLNLA